MTDNELIKNLKQLKQIKPKQDWVIFNKSQILGQKDFVMAESKNPSIISVFQNFSSVLKEPSSFFKPAYATIAAILLLVIGIAGFLLIEVPEKIVYEPVEPVAEKEIILALEGLQIEIEQATESLKGIKEPQKVLEARNVVVPFIETTREMIVGVEKLEQDTKINKDKQVLGTVIGVNESIDKLENTLDRTFAIQANRLIRYLETRTLTDIQKQILEQAKLAYQNGNYHIALINAMHVRQNIERLK